MNIENAQKEFAVAHDWWAAELLTNLYRDAPEKPFDWVRSCIAKVILFSDEGQSRKELILQQASDSDDPGLLKSLAEELEGPHRDALSLAIANFIVAKVCKLEQSRKFTFFLNTTMNLLGNYCRDNGVSSEVMFAALPQEKNL